MSIRRQKVIFVVSEDWYFLSHRVELARHFQTQGWEVLVATQINQAQDAARISETGIRLVALPLERGRLFSPGDILYWWRLMRLYRRERPDVVHHVAMKPVLYGSLAALCAPRTGVVNALAGLGFLFTNASGAVRMIRGLVLALFSRLFARTRTRVILQNTDDIRLFHERLGVPMANLRLVRGAGVDVSRFVPVEHGARECPVVVMVSRMLRDKGVWELAEAARLLRRQGVVAKIQFVGGVDAKNPNSLSQLEMEALHAEGAIEWLGHRIDTAGIYAKADIAVLPSYLEGLPKALLEAAASGLPIVTTDTPGCREVVAEGRNGYLVPVREPGPMAAALRRLIADPALRAQLGANSRRRAEQEFRQEIVMQQTAQVYEEVLNG